MIEVWGNHVRIGKHLDGAYGLVTDAQDVVIYNANHHPIARYKVGTYSAFGRIVPHSFLTPDDHCKDCNPREVTP